MRRFVRSTTAPSTVTLLAWLFWLLCRQDCSTLCFLCIVVFTCLLGQHLGSFTADPRLSETIGSFDHSAIRRDSAGMAFLAAVSSRLQHSVLSLHCRFHLSAGSAFRLVHSGSQAIRDDCFVRPQRHQVWLCWWLFSKLSVCAFFALTKDLVSWHHCVPFFKFYLCNFFFFWDPTLCCR